jgi:hypothetical protein
MQKSNYSEKYQTRSFYCNDIRAAVQEYQERHGGVGSVEVVITHTSESDFTAQGHAESALDGVVVEVERLAVGVEAKRLARFQRQAALRAQLDAGELTEDEYLDKYLFSF